MATSEPVKLLKPPPAAGSLYDYVYTLEHSAWKPWMDTAPPQTLAPDLEYQSITVLTLDVVRYTYLIDTIVRSRSPVLLVGPTGTGKSSYMRTYLAQQLDKAAWTHMTFGFSAQTSVNMTQARPSAPCTAQRRHDCPMAPRGASADAQFTRLCWSKVLVVDFSTAVECGALVQDLIGGN